MSKLVPLCLSNGSIAMVSEIKLNSLEKYISLFPQFKELRKVILFGSSLETRCTEESDIDLWFVYDCTQREYHSILSEIDDLHGESYADDFLGCSVEKFNSSACGALYSVKSKGVVLYDSLW